MAVGRIGINVCENSVVGCLTFKVATVRCNHHYRRQCNPVFITLNCANKKGPAFTQHPNLTHPTPPLPHHHIQVVTDEDDGDENKGFLAPKCRE